MPFTVAKVDIKSFYSSVSQDNLLSHLDRRLVTAPSTRFVLRSLINQCKNSSVAGLPPGTAISAELSEFYMQDFDRNVREDFGAYYFARYVDDIILILPEASNHRKLRKRIESALPTGLQLNYAKSRFLQFKGTTYKTPSDEQRFEYLGFQFTIYPVGNSKPHFRQVSLDIADSKVKKEQDEDCKNLFYNT